jgi:hypothetical protein
MLQIAEARLGINLLDNCAIRSDSRNSNKPAADVGAGEELLEFKGSSIITCRISIRRNVLGADECSDSSVAPELHTVQSSWALAEMLGAAGQR